MRSPQAQSNLAQDAEDFNLPLKWKLGTDLMSKLLLSDPKIINLVVRSLVGSVFCYLYKNAVSI